MTDREQLINLLEQEKAFSRYITDDERREQLADYLLENGVIVSPCKVGGTMYQTDGVMICESKIKSINKPVKRPIWINHKIIGWVTISLKDKNFLNSLDSYYYIGFTDEEHKILQNNMEVLYADNMPYCPECGTKTDGKDGEQE